MKLKLTLLVVLAACVVKPTRPEAAPDDPEPALRTFLEQHGQLCLGKTSWPVIVTADDRQRGASDALQMPVLERLGVVTGTAHGADTSYQLTALGRRSYLPRPQGSADLCAGTIALERVLAVEQHAGAANLRYSYRFEPYPWMREPDALRVFPWVAQLYAGQRSAVLEQRFARRDGTWMALSPTE